MELSKEVIKTIKGAITAEDKAQKSDADLFKVALVVIKEASKPKEAKEALNKAISDNTASLVIERAKKSIVATAYAYKELKVLTKFDYLQYENIKGVVRVLKGVQKFYPEDIKAVLSGIGGVYKEGYSDYRYNNLMIEHLDSLKEKYNFKEVEGDFKVGSFFEMVKSALPKLTEEQRKELLALVA